MNLKVAKILITLNDDQGKEVTRMERDENFLWNIKGPVYPKHMKLMSIMNDDLRDINTGVRVTK